MKTKDQPAWLDMNTAKAQFDDLYISPDPREYYRILYGLDYVIPDLAKGVFRNAVAALEVLRGRPITVLDIGCSYGINAALLRYPLDIDRLASRYRALADPRLSPQDLVAFDRHYFRSWPGHEIRILGLDCSAPAVRYAHAVGLLDDGITIDLESDDLTPEAKRSLRDVDLVISTGCVGYVSERTFRKVLSAIEGRQPWVASFVLRMFPYDAITRCVRQVGDLETEKLDGVTFVQRRFHSPEEASEVIAALEARGLTTQGKESEGLYHAEFFLSRPPADRHRVPLEAVANVTSGAHRSYGRRWRYDGEAIRLSH